MSRVCVVGSTGQLGGALVRAFRAGGHEVVETVRVAGGGRVVLDLGEPASVRAALDDAAAEVVVVAAAFCHVDRCETERAVVTAVNVEGPRAAAAWASAHGARVVFYSTDHVFDGAAERYTETAAPHPLNAYAASKLAGEEAVRAAGADAALVIRTAWLYGPDPSRRNFALRLVDASRAGRDTRVPSDQWGMPTYTDDLAEVTRFLVEARHSGLWHAAGDELMDRVTLARIVCDVFGLDAARVVPTPTHALGQAARRPLRVRFDTGRLRAAGAPAVRGLRAGLEALRAWDLAHAPPGARA